MKKKIIYIVAVVIIIFIGWFIFENIRRFGENIDQAACTMEARICSDGSTVGRSGPNCEFTPCPEIKSILKESEARIIAEKNCIKGGEALSSGIYNENSKTWWFDANLNSTREGCNPACVVSEESKTAEINWRCTGEIPGPVKPFFK